MATRSDSSKNTSRVILVIAGILVLSSLGYFALQFFAQKGENQEKQVEIEDLNNEILALEERILDFEIAMDDQRMDIKRKEQGITEKQEELKRLAQLLSDSRQTNKANLARIRELEQRLQMSERLLTQYADEVRELQKEKEALEGQVDDLRENEGVLRAQNQDLRQQKDSVRQALLETTELASTLKAKEFRLLNVRSKRAVELKDKTGGPQIRKFAMRDLQVCFTIIENAVAEAGPRTLYLVYEDPTGSIIRTDKSGTFTHQGRVKDYTVSADINYRNLSEEICMNFVRPNNFEYQKGPQYLSVYAEGNLIGYTSFTVK